MAQMTPVLPQPALQRQSQQVASRGQGLGTLYFLARLPEKGPQPPLTLLSRTSEAHNCPPAPAASSPKPPKVLPAHSSAAGWRAHLLLLPTDLWWWPAHVWSLPSVGGP